jgi:hypothetical protein
MIKKLRHKFIAVNMIFVSIILLIIFIFSFSFTYTGQVHTAEREMERLLFNREVQINNRDIYSPDSIPGGFNIMPKTRIAVFCVKLDSKNNITSIEGDDVTISDEDAFKGIIEECLSSDKNSGIVKGQNLRYMKDYSSGVAKIAFADRTSEIEIMTNLVKTSVFIGLFTLSSFFAISFFLAKWAVKPIKKSWEQQTQFVADASHELKTPLTVILANTDILAAHPKETVESQQKWISYIKDEALRMSQLVSDLLFLAKSDAKKEQSSQSDVVLSDVIWSSVLPLEALAFEKEIEIKNNIKEGLVVKGDEGKLRQLVTILIENAIKYSDIKGIINVALLEQNGKIKLSVNNGGVPIPKQQINRIIDRFYRVDSSRVRNEGGYGLGLSIAKSIAEEHKAKIYVESSADEGTTFSVVFK